MQRKLSGALILLALIVCAECPAFAHHSFAMFELDKTMTLQGVVKDFQWAQPHVWIDVTVVDKDGTQSVAEFECYGPNMLRRKGWDGTTLKIGDKISVTYFPNRNGKPGGAMRSIILPDGRRMASYEFGPPPVESETK